MIPPQLARMRHHCRDVKLSERTVCAPISGWGDESEHRLGLRHALKHETRARHDRVDALFGRIPLETRQGLTLFLSAHGIALAAIEQALRSKMPDTGCPLSQSALAGRDLTVLGGRPPAPAAFADLDGAHPWGLAYVIAGAHLGASVLRARWKRSQDPAVLQAGAYLSSTAMKSYWPKLLIHLAALEPTPAEASSILAGADAAFAVFEASLGLAEETITAGA